MSAIRLVFGALALVAMMGAREASAFQQNTPAVGDVLPQAAPGLEIQPGSKDRGTGLQLTVPGPVGGDAAAKSNGIGFGSLSILPKLDFGLELLYGAPDVPLPDQQPLDALPDSLTVRGSVKKTF